MDVIYVTRTEANFSTEPQGEGTQPVMASTFIHWIDIEIIYTAWRTDYQVSGSSSLRSSCLLCSAGTQLGVRHASESRQMPPGYTAHRLLDSSAACKSTPLISSC